MRNCLAVVSLVAITSTPAYAQYMPFPNQLAIGAGVLKDLNSGQTSGVGTLSLAYADSGKGDYWPSRLGIVVEGELGGGSAAAPCRAVEGSAEAPNCDDAALLAGPRFHFFRRTGKRAIPFVNLLFGSYWTGSGVEGRSALDPQFALQAGGGIDVRRAGSIHGLRLSVDYRHVFATPRRHQLRFMTSYVLGPSGS
jgi:hypothetical protein